MTGLLAYAKGSSMCRKCIPSFPGSRRKWWYPVPACHGFRMWVILYQCRQMPDRLDMVINREAPQLCSAVGFLRHTTASRRRSQILCLCLRCHFHCVDGWLKSFECAGTSTLRRRSKTVRKSLRDRCARRRWDVDMRGNQRCCRRRRCGRYQS